MTVASTNELNIGAGIAAPEPASWDEAKRDFERGLLERLAGRYRSARALAARLDVSHTMIAEKLKAYGIACGGTPRPLAGA